jgi:hypothetical protein
MRRPKTKGVVSCCGQSTAVGGATADRLTGFRRPLPLGLPCTVFGSAPEGEGVRMKHSKRSLAVASVLVAACATSAESASLPTTVATDGCRLAIGAPFEGSAYGYDVGDATLSIRCNRRHHQVHVSATVQKFLPSVWIGTTSAVTLHTVPAHRTIHLTAFEPCVPGRSTPFRARATISFPVHHHMVRLMTGFATATVACG